MTREDPPMCCGEQLTIKHALVSCNNTEDRRLRIFPHWRNIGEDDRMKNLLNGEPNSAFDVSKIESLLKELRLLNKI